MTNISGQTRGKLKVIDRSHKNIHGIWFWNCICECGESCKVSIGRLNSGHTKSCGCTRYSVGKDAPAFKHGLHGTVECKLWYGAKRRAKASGVEFDLEIVDITIPEFCPVLGLKLASNGTTQACSPSLDRFNNDLGYTKSNIRVISHKANRIKSNVNVKELLAILEYMKNG